MKVYIAGRITGVDYDKAVEMFDAAEHIWIARGDSVINPTCLPGEGFSHADYMHICLAMIDVCDAVYFLNNWRQSEGAKQEHEYAVAHGKKIIYEGLL